MANVSWLAKPVNRAVREFDMIADGDRIAVGVSGGKDSRVLLDVLLHSVNVPGAYTIVAIHIDGTDVGLPDIAPTLESWLQELGVEYTIAPLPVSENELLPMGCFRCAFNRRKALFLAAERLGCNKVALGHHADDVAVTTLMNILYVGATDSLEPRRDFFSERLTIIRPLIYATEKEILRYTRAQGWTFPQELECPHAPKARRTKFERFLATFRDKERKQIRANLSRLNQEYRQCLQTPPNYSPHDPRTPS